MNNVNAARLYYHDEQSLGLDDFVQEQQFHLNKRWEHNRRFHRWGIVSGLELTVASDGLSVSPGHAIDPKGRDVVLKQNHVFMTNSALEKLLKKHTSGGIEWVAAWIRYDETIFEGHYIAEPVLHYTLRSDPIRNGRLYREYLAARGDTGGDILLGQIMMHEGELVPDATKPNYEYRIDLKARPQVGVFAAEIVSPSKAMQINLNDKVGNDDQGQAFISVSFQITDQQEPKQGDIVCEDGQIDEETIIPSKSCDVAGENEISQGHTVLELREDGHNHLEGHLEVDGSLYPKGNICFAELSDCDAESGWHIYRTKCPKTGIDELRVEICDDTQGAFKIGSPSCDGTKFIAILEVTSEGNVAVSGDLLVAGQINPDTVVPAELAMKGGNARSGKQADIKLSLLKAILKKIMPFVKKYIPLPSTAIIGFLVAKYQDQIPYLNEIIKVFSSQ